MLNIDEAKKIMNSQLLELEQQVGEPLSIIDMETVERKLCWVFFYNSKNYVDTGNEIYRLAGNAPFIIDRRDGSVHETGTAYPAMAYILKYEENSTC